MSNLEDEGSGKDETFANLEEIEVKAPNIVQRIPTFTSIINNNPLDDENFLIVRPGAKLFEN